MIKFLLLKIFIVPYITILARFYLYSETPHSYSVTVSWAVLIP